MSLFPVVLTAIVTLAGPRLPAETAERYATDIVEVATDDVELAIALVSTADEEGLHFSPRIERCECLGNECDKDPRTGRALAFGLYQLHRYWFAGSTADEICASNRLGTQLAANALRFLRKNHGDIRTAIRLYNGAPKDDPRIVRRMKVFERWFAHALRGAS